MDGGADQKPTDGRHSRARLCSTLEVQGRRHHLRRARRRRQRTRQMALHHPRSPRRPTAQRHRLPRQNQTQPLCQRNLRRHTQRRVQDHARRMHSARFRLQHPHFPRNPLHRSQSQPQTRRHQPCPRERRSSGNPHLQDTESRQEMDGFCHNSQGHGQDTSHSATRRTRETKGRRRHPERIPPEERERT